MPKLDAIDFNEVWQDTLGWREPDRENRKWNDAVERAFWERLAPTYSAVHDLNQDTPRIARRMQELIGEGASVLEIGCGSGNFTMKMGAYARKIVGLDFSAAMLHELKQRKAAAGYSHIKLVQGKWEDYLPQEQFDVVVSVNSLYRIRDIQSALQKMLRFGRRVILARTIQESVFAPLYRELGFPAAECQDYRLLPNLFWSLGVRANVEFLTYTARRTFAGREAVLTLMQEDLGNDYPQAVKKGLLRQLEMIEEAHTPYAVRVPRTTVIISAGESV